MTKKERSVLITKQNEGKKKHLANLSKKEMDEYRTKQGKKSKEVWDKMTEEERNKRRANMSKASLKQFRNGKKINHVKRIVYEGITYRSSWEIKFVKWANLKNIKWEYETERCKVNISKGRTYTIDFYLPEINKYVEVKGRHEEEDYYKLNEAVTQGYNIVMVDRTNINNIDLHNYWKIK